MATEIKRNDTDFAKAIEDSFKCVVCLEYYNDPRNLQCGHLFCLECLEKNLEALDSSHTIPCLFCRHDTKLEHGESLVDLPRPVLLNDIQEKVIGLLKSDVIISAPGGPSPMTDLTLMYSIDTGACVTGLVMDVKRHRLVVRTMDRKAPIKVYEYQCKIEEESMGGEHGQSGCSEGIGRLSGTDIGYRGIAIDTGYRGISIDTRRDLYLIPGQTYLKVMDTEGALQYKISFGLDLRGVCYCKENDCYVLTDVMEHKVYVINAETKRVTTTFGSHGVRDSQLNDPFNVCMGKIDEPVIVVSDCWNHCIKVFSMTGQHIKSLGGHGQNDGQLQCTVGLTEDPAGRIIVCDHDNERVVSFRLDNDQEQWRCLVGENQCRGKPWYVAVDPVTRIMALEINGHIRLYHEQPDNDEQ